MRTIQAAVTLTGSAALAAAAAAAKTIKNGLSMLTQNAPYFPVLQAAVLKVAKSLGATVVKVDANNAILDAR